MSDRPLILCADDDEDILSLVSLRLERAGFRVVQAVDGDAALEAVRTYRPTVAVLDVMMPKRTGYEVLATLRGDPALAGLKVILLSARVQESDVERGIDAGADAYLAKPFKAGELVAKVQELLAGSADPS
jgi:DNA-binding response OmpR family regulator